MAQRRGPSLLTLVVQRLSRASSAPSPSAALAESQAAAQRLAQRIAALRLELKLADIRDGDQHDRNAGMVAR